MIDFECQKALNAEGHLEDLFSEATWRTLQDGATVNDGGWSGSIGSACLWPRIYGPLFARLMVILNLGASNLDVRIARSIGFPPRREALVSINGTLNSGVGLMKFWCWTGGLHFDIAAAWAKRSTAKEAGGLLLDIPSVPVFQHDLTWSNHLNWCKILWMET